MPAILTASEGGTPMVAPSVAPLWLLTLAAAVYLALTIASHLSASWQALAGRHTAAALDSSLPPQPPVPHTRTARLTWSLSSVWSSSDLVYDIILVGLMLAATIAFTVFVAQTGPAVKPLGSYEVYDGVQGRRARWFLPAKLPASQASPDLIAQLTSTYGAAPLKPADAGRWALPDQDGIFDQWATLMSTVHAMSDLWAVYGLLQGMVMVMLLFR